jgi:hypothetical protein
MSNRDYGLFILLLVVVALLAGATWFGSREPILQELPASIVNAPPTGAGEAFHYYPAQYTNQATEAGEHIQAY